MVNVAMCLVRISLVEGTTAFVQLCSMEKVHWFNTGMLVFQSCCCIIDRSCFCAHEYSSQTWFATWLPELLVALDNTMWTKCWREQHSARRQLEFQASNRGWTSLKCGLQAIAAGQKRLLSLGWSPVLHDVNLFFGAGGSVIQLPWFVAVEGACKSSTFLLLLSTFIFSKLC